MWKIRFLILFSVLCGLFGNLFFKLSFFGINVFYAFMGLGLLYLFFSLVCYSGVPKRITLSCRDGIYNKWRIDILILCLLYFLYILLSYLKVFTKFDIDVDYDAGYIIRHSYIFFTFPLYYMIIDVIQKNYNEVLDIFSNYLFLLFLWVILSVLSFVLKSDYKCMRAIIVLSGTSVYFSKPNKIMSKIVLCITLFLQSSFIESSTSFFAVVAVLIVIFFRELILLFFRHNVVIKVLIAIALLMLFLSVVALGVIKINDSNSMWRLQYWVNEIRIIFKTKFIGVGFGSAYASNSIFEEINNPLVFTSQAEEGTGLFVIAQHCSLLNFFYRLGLIGGSVGLLVTIIRPIQWYSYDYFQKLNQPKIIEWAFSNYVFNLVVILLNPGLESPPFYYGFLISYAVLIGLLIKRSNDSKKEKMNF